MADVAKASSAGDGATQKTRPEKPDQAKYEADLAAAQKEHAVNMEKFVRLRLRNASKRRTLRLYFSTEVFTDKVSRTLPRLALKAQNLGRVHRRMKDGMPSLPNKKKSLNNNERTRSQGLPSGKSITPPKFN
jgi:hypothetical protein